MADTPDFRFRSQFPVSGIASLLAQKPVLEQEMRIREEQNQRARFSSLLQAVELGSDLATQGLARSQAKQEMQAKQNLSDAINAFGLIDQESARPITRSIPAEGPSPLGGERPFTLEQTTLGATPEGQEIVGRKRAAAEKNLLSAFMQVSPGSFAQAAAQNQFRNPLDTAEKIAQIAKLESEISGKDEEKTIKRSGDLRGEFLKASNEFQGVSRSFRRVLDSSSDPSAAGDLALIFNFMKMLDPGSVVRESEFANAANAAGVDQRIRAQYNRVLSGERLSDVQRKDFLNRAKKLFKGQVKNQKQIESEFGRLADEIGAERNQVLIDFTGDLKELSESDDDDNGMFNGKKVIKREKVAD